MNTEEQYESIKTRREVWSKAASEAREALLFTDPTLYSKDLPMVMDVQFRWWSKVIFQGRPAMHLGFFTESYGQKRDDETSLEFLNRTCDAFTVTGVDRRGRVFGAASTESLQDAINIWNRGEAVEGEIGSGDFVYGDDILKAFSIDYVQYLEEEE